MPASKEALGIIDWLARTGVPFVVTSRFPATPGVHAPQSYHYQAGTDGDSLAVDLAGPDLRRIYNQFVPIRDRLAELLGPGDPAHDDHVHVAVRKGTFLVPFMTEVTVPAPPVDQQILTAFPYEAGYVIVTIDGAVYAFNCTYRGRIMWNGTSWVVG